MPNVIVARIGKNVQRENVVQAFVVNTVTESAVRDYMTTIGYSEDEYEISQGEKSEMIDSLTDREIWYVEVDIAWGKVSMKLVY